MTPNEIVAGNVRTMRKARKWSMEELAHRWGVGPATVAAAEAAKSGRKPRLINVNDLVALAEVFDVTVAEMMTEPAPCGTCGGEPPQGFSCQACGAQGKPPGGAM